MKYKSIRFVAVSILLLVAWLSAQTPNLLNYQGKLTNSDGTPTNGTYTITFRIYPDTLTQNDKWLEKHENVKMVNGIFNVLLGSSTPFGDLFTQAGERYLGITLAGDLELQPRFRLTSVAYAIHANSASSLSATDGDPVNAVVVNANGDIGIGIKTPSSKMHIYDDTIGNYQNNALKIATPYGFATFGSLNTDWFHISTDRGKFYFNNPCHANGGFYTYSSRNLKQGIQYLTTENERQILDSLLEMNMVFFRYTGQGISTKIHLGVIAEDSPEQIVSENKDAINLMDYTSYAITAIKAQQQIIEDLLKRINALETKISQSEK